VIINKQLTSEYHTSFDLKIKIHWIGQLHRAFVIADKLFCFFDDFVDDTIGHDLWLQIQKAVVNKVFY